MNVCRDIMPNNAYCFGLKTNEENIFNFGVEIHLSYLQKIIGKNIAILYQGNDTQ